MHELFETWPLYYTMQITAPCRKCTKLHHTLLHVKVASDEALPSPEMDPSSIITHTAQGFNLSALLQMVLPYKLVLS